MKKFNIICNNKKQFKLALIKLNSKGYKWAIGNYLEVYNHYIKIYNNFPTIICYNGGEHLMYDSNYINNISDYLNEYTYKYENYFIKEIRKVKLKKMLNENI